MRKTRRGKHGSFYGQGSSFRPITVIVELLYSSFFCLEYQHIWWNSLKKKRERNRNTNNRSNWSKPEKLTNFVIITHVSSFKPQYFEGVQPLYLHFTYGSSVLCTGDVISTRITEVWWVAQLAGRGYPARSSGTRIAREKLSDWGSHIHKYFIVMVQELAFEEW